MMRRLRTQEMGIAQGSRLLFSDFAEGGPMWSGTGPREIRQAITFSEPFAEPPVVTVGITLWDADSETNLRADLHADAISTTGFSLVFRTWGDTRLARLRCEWTAMGPLPDEEVWDVE